MNIREWLSPSGHKLARYDWIDGVVDPKAIVVIAHGMGEYQGRYNELAMELNKAGYIATGVDFLANGKTADKLGLASAQCYSDNVQIICELIIEVGAEYKLPVLLFAHSYGSIVGQRVLQIVSDKLSGVVLSGSAALDTMLIKSARVIAKFQKAIFGADKPAKLITKLNFGAYDKVFKSEISNNGWLTRNLDEVIKYNSDPLCGQVFSIGFYYSMFNGLKTVYKKAEMAKVNKALPIFIVGGECDPVGGNGKLLYRLHAKYIDNAVNKTQLKIYDLARHEMLNEINKADFIADVIAYFDGLI